MIKVRETIDFLQTKYPVKYSIGREFIINSYNLNDLNRKSGMFCYLLFNGDECVYVGITKSIKNRIKAHRKDKTFTIIVLLEFNVTYYWRKSEVVIINTLLPMYNIRYNKLRNEN